MVSIAVYNTLTRRREPLVPRDPGRVSIYVCGVTPYDSSHLGHARPAIVFDVIRKFLRYVGYQVTLVQNFTDIDDKIIARATALGEDPLALSDRYAREYLEQMAALGVEPADAYPRVTQHMDDIVAMVRSLVEKGYAYVVDGDVYFDVTRFPGYGKLSHQRLEQLEAGTRFEVDERKRHPMDFALWKAAKPGEPAWESPWGPGRPGWHIECSAMSLRYLGPGFDIHGGGTDLIFPHHENEIAQSEAYTGQEPFVRYWLHNGLIKLGAEKMSKSLGNVFTIAESLQRYPKELIRFYLLSHHYRTPVEFTPERLEAARRGWQRLNEAVAALPVPESPPPASAAEHEDALRALVAQASEGPGRQLAEALLRAHQRFVEAMADDFNTQAGLAVLFETVREVQGARARLAGQEAAPLWAGAAGLFRALAGGILGILGGEEVTSGASADGELVQGLVELLLEVRAAARQRRDWATADTIRDRLGQLGIVVEDTPQGTTWRRASD